MTKPREIRRQTDEELKKIRDTHKEGVKRLKEHWNPYLKTWKPTKTISKVQDAMKKNQTALDRGAMSDVHALAPLDKTTQFETQRLYDATLG